jgi:hypothetical protein
MTSILHPSTNASGRRTIGLVLFVALASLGVGCSRAASVTSSELLLDEPLTQVGLADVETASSGCEDLLSDVTDFAVLGETGLVVGLDCSGGAVCIDTVAAVNSELSEDGRASDALALASRYEATMEVRGFSGSAVRRRIALGGDPNPQPNAPQFQQLPQRPGI